MIIGFSSSPIKGGNVDRMVQSLLEISGKKAVFINLNDLNYGPCLACPNLCASENMCKLDDDLKSLYPQIVDSDAIILGTPSYFNNLNSTMAMFLERLWSFRHNRFSLEGKPFAVVSSGAFNEPIKAMEAVKRRMTAYKASFIGSVGFLSKIAPCFICGDGLTCRVGSLYRVYGDEGLKRLSTGKNLFNRWEDSPEIFGEIQQLGWKLASL